MILRGQHETQSMHWLLDQVDNILIYQIILHFLTKCDFLALPFIPLDLQYRIIDTAGIRRKGKVEYGAEFFMVNR